MAAYDLVTPADLKDLLNKTGGGRDSALRAAISRASREVEQACGRRLIYRAPPTTESAVLAATPWTPATPAVSAQPNSAGRTLIVAFTTATAGTLTVVGTVAGVSKTVVFDAANGLVQHGLDFFTAVASFTIGGTPAGSGTVAVTTSQGYIEYHSIPPRDLVGNRSLLYALERPFGQVLAVYEDPYRVYGADTLLVAGTDYLVSVGPGRIERLSSGVSYAWWPGRRAAKLVYSGGYTIANVPVELKGHAIHLAAQYFLEADKGQIEVATGSNALGSWTRYGPAALTRKAYDGLWSAGHVRAEADITGERDFDLEAA